MTALPNIITRFKNKNILVIGDLILDQHVQGSVSRISPEAPVPVVLQEGEPSFAPGGAANVANNLASLGTKVTLVGKIGDDPEGKILLKELRKRKIVTRHIITDKKEPTILKTRIIARHQQVLRLDREKRGGAGAGIQTGNKIRDFLKKNVGQFDAVVVSDYGKGLITQQLVTDICSLAVQKSKVVTVDPKVEHFAYYRGVTAITPNLKETENAIRNIRITQNVGRRFAVNSDRLRTDAEIDRAGKALLKFLGLQCLLVTLGEAGMRLFQKGKKPVHINTRAREVFDVTGAGDTVIAAFTLGLVSGANAHQAADLSNYAAGIVVGKMGAVPVTRQELLAVVKSSTSQ